MTRIYRRFALIPVAIVAMAFAATAAGDEKPRHTVQNNQTNLEFLRIRAERLDALEARAARLEKVVVRGWDPEKKELATEKPTSSTKEHVLLSRGTGAAEKTPDEYGRVKVKLGKLQRRIQAQRKRLAARRIKRRSDSSQPQKTDGQDAREIDAQIQKLESELAELERRASQPGEAGLPQRPG